MELTAAIRALEALPPRSSAIVHADSKYVVDGMNEWMPGWRSNGWRKSGGGPVENADLWRQLSDLNWRHTVDWTWVRGHGDDAMNQRADRLAAKARGRCRV